MRAVFIALVGLLCVAHGDDDSRSRILVSKLILNRYLVQAQDIVVEYTLYNVGTTAATNIVLTDAGFSPDKFDVISGLVNIKIDRLAPNTNVSHAVVVRPKAYGYLNFTAAEVKYQTSETSGDIQIGYSTEPGEGGVVPYRDFDRKFSPHVLDWAAFAVMTLPSLGIPFLLWFRSKSKYEAVMKSNKKQ